MNGGRITIGIVAIVAVALGYLSIQTPNEGLSIPDLQDKVIKSRPEWANYHEDLKEHLGTSPVALWIGEPVKARIDGKVLLIDFDVTGDWQDIEVYLPILIRDHLGNVVLNSAASELDGVVRYEFTITDPYTPWVEVQYPHQIRRIVFDRDHTWSR